MDECTSGPWGVNGKTAAGWRIDSMNPRGKSGFEFIMNPVALVPKKEDAELIVKLFNEHMEEANEVSDAQ